MFEVSARHGPRRISPPRLHPTWPDILSGGGTVVKGTGLGRAGAGVGNSGLQATDRRSTLIILGIILLVLGAILNAGILWAIGAILVVLGVIFWILGAMGRAVGGRRHYY